MSTGFKSKQTKRSGDRIIFVKPAIAIFDGEPQAEVKTTDLSMTTVGISSPIQGFPKSTCWVRLQIPETYQSNKVFDVKTQVVYSVYSKDIHAFKTGLRFINPQPQLTDLIKKMISEKNK